MADLHVLGRGGYPESLYPYREHVITQIATGMFGVREETILWAPMVELKYAQGAKPGLGGHLLGDKTTVTVAAMRETVPWVSLFSPFPFHSVYSVEDHKEHIDWVRSIKPEALVAVKVSTPTDIDMVAVGSYHAGANVLQVDGGYGGTGAAPEIAKKSIAMPIELALPRVHRFLEQEGIRDEIVIMASGGIRTADDLAKAIALGADGGVLGTTELVALGCTRCGNCERGRGCPFGLTTTDPELSQLVEPDWGRSGSAGSTPRSSCGCGTSCAGWGCQASARCGVARTSCATCPGRAPMDRADLAEALIASARSLERPAATPIRPVEAEGGCGVIGAASNVPLPARALRQPLAQMRNRGNGKGGGIAAAGLGPEFFGVGPETLREDHLLAVAYLDGSVHPQVEACFVEPTFEVDHVVELPARGDGPADPAAGIRPPDVRCYLVRVRPDVLTSFAREHGIPHEHLEAAADEIVYQNSYRLNRAFYSATGDKRAFVLSHGKDLLVLKVVGYGDHVIRWYGLEELRAHVWIGHHRYPTKGRMWHPGGAHPFIGSTRHWCTTATSLTTPRSAPTWPSATATRCS